MTGATPLVKSSTMRYIISSAAVIIYAATVSTAAVACVSSSDCLAINCPRTQPRLYEPGWCLSTGYCHAQSVLQQISIVQCVNSVPRLNIACKLLTYHIVSGCVRVRISWKKSLHPLVMKARRAAWYERSLTTLFGQTVS